jgi:hypothetical protein
MGALNQWYLSKMFFHGFPTHSPIQLTKRDNIQRRLTNIAQVNNDE